MNSPPDSTEYIMISENESDYFLTKEQVYANRQSIVSIFNKNFKPPTSECESISLVDRPKKPSVMAPPKVKYTFSPLPLVTQDFVGMGLENPNNLYTLYHPNTDFVSSKQSMFLKDKSPCEIPLNIYDLYRKEVKLFYFYIVCKNVKTGKKERKWIANLEKYSSGAIIE